MSELITPVERHGDIFIKREDLAFNIGPNAAAGAKVRQYIRMVAECPGLPLVVGCSAYSCQQVYIADARNRTGRPAVVFTAAREKPTAATKFCYESGCDVRLVRPGYLSLIRKQAKEYAIANGAVRWSPDIAAADAVEQAAAFDVDCRRVVVPVGSGAIFSGILAGLARAGYRGTVFGVAVSGMADVDKLRTKAATLSGTCPLPTFSVVLHQNRYERGIFGTAVGGVLLDPWYAAKCAEFIQPGDCLWNTGRRPIRLMSD